MSPGELLAVIDDADRVEPRGRRQIILEVRAPSLLGIGGKYLGHEIVDVETGATAPVYGYTRRKALRIAAAIREAATNDAAQEAPEVEDDGFEDPE